MKIKDTHEGSYFGVDKAFHLIFHIVLAFCLCKFYGYLGVLLTCFIVGFFIEVLEQTRQWNWLMRLIGENATSSPVSYKDLIVNTLGAIMGIAMRWSIR